MYAPCHSHPTLGPMVINWTPTPGLPHSPSVSRSHSKRHQVRFVQRIHKVQVKYTPSIPCQPSRYLPMVVDLTPTTGLISCQDQPGPAHGPQHPYSGKWAEGSNNAVWCWFHLSLSPRMSNRTSSQICSSWYLPMFLLRDGSFTLMNIASFIVLVRFCDFLPIMLKLSTLVWWPVMLQCSLMGEGALWESLNLSKSSYRYPNIFFIKLYHVTLIPIYLSTFLCDCVLIWGMTRMFLIVLPPLKCTSIPCLLQML